LIKILLSNKFLTGSIFKAGRGDAITIEQV